MALAPAMALATPPAMVVSLIFGMLVASRLAMTRWTFGTFMTLWTRRTLRFPTA